MTDPTPPPNTSSAFDEPESVEDVTPATTDADLTDADLTDAGTDDAGTEDADDTGTGEPRGYGAPGGAVEE